MMMLKPDGILFDMDGTLIDTSRDISANLNRAFEEHGYPRLSHETILSHVGFGAHVLIQKCLAINRPDVTVDDALVTEIWESFRNHYREHIVDEAVPYPGVREFLKSETRPMGVISNKPEEFVKAVLSALDLESYFTFSWGRDTLPVSKPDPEIIRYGVHELGIAESAVIMVGDNMVDVRAARGAQVTAVAVSYGFSPAELLQAEAPDYLFHSFQEFVQAVQ